MRGRRRSKWLAVFFAVAIIALLPALNNAEMGRIGLRATSAVVMNWLSLLTTPQSSQPTTPEHAATRNAALMSSTSQDKPILGSASTGAAEWWSRREDKRIKLRGSVPSEEDRKTLYGMIKANMPDLEIDDRMEVAQGALPKQTWLGAVSFALLQLGQLTKGTAWLEGTEFSIEGEARSAATFTAVRNAIDEQVPAGVTLKSAEVAPPVATPFMWTAAYKNSTLTIAGHVPSDQTRTQILQRASEIFGTIKIVDQMELASGAPEDWKEVIDWSLSQLGRLESGKVSVSDTALSIEGVAGNEEIAEGVAAAIEQVLPKSYNVKNSVRHRLSALDGRPDMPEPGGKLGNKNPL